MKFHQTQHKESKRPFFILSPCAGRFLLSGQIMIVISLCHFAAMLLGEGRGEALLYIDAYAGGLSSAFVILWGTALGLDWLTRGYKQP